MADWLRDSAKSWFGAFRDRVSVVEPRSDEVAVNTLARGDQYYDIGRGGMHLQFDGDLRNARWRPGDFAGQCSGLPIEGYEGGIDYRSDQPRNIRLECVKKLIESAAKYSS